MVDLVQHNRRRFRYFQLLDGRNEAVWSVIEMEEDGYEEGNDYEEEQDGNEYHDNEEDQNDDNLVTDSDSESDNENNHTGHETNTTRRYENNVTKTILQKGKLSLTVGEARLYGIINENGELKQRESPNKKLNLKKLQEINNKLSTKKDLSDLISQHREIATKECTFQPKKSEAAMKAMMNPRCGYEFNSTEQGNFIERQFNAKKKNKESKFVLEGMKEDYEARLDRLQCPKCLKYQSFDEWYEKRRICGPCQQRFVKLNVSKFTSWESKQQEHERKKREKLLKISHETYENCSFKPQVNHIDPERLAAYQERLKKKKEQQLKEEEEKKLQEELEEKRKQEKIRLIQERIQQTKLKLQQNNTNTTSNTSDKNKMKQNRPNSAPPRRPPTRPTSVPDPVPPPSADKKNKSSKKKGVKYDKMNGNISEKFQLLLTTEVE